MDIDRPLIGIRSRPAWRERDVLGRNCRHAALLALVLLLTATGGAVAGQAAKPRPLPATRFGIAPGGDLHNLSRRDLARTLDGVRAIGATWIRIDLNWSLVQAQGRGSYRWASFDRAVRAARARRLHVLAAILYTPRWAQPAGGSGSTPPVNLDDYAAFAQTAAGHYRRFGVEAYEIWNEPNIVNFWTPGPDPARYTQMLKLAYAGIKRADPAATVVSAGLSPYGSYGNADAEHMNPINFLEQMYANGAAGSMDAVGWHPYHFPYGLGYDVASAWSQMSETTPSARSVMVANGGAATKIWATEFGAPTGTSSRSLTEAAQAKLVTQAYTRLKAWRWAGPGFLFSYRDRGGSTDEGFGLVRADWSKKPSYRAYELRARK
jgi:hypothetical protein